MNKLGNTDFFHTPTIMIKYDDMTQTLNGGNKIKTKLKQKNKNFYIYFFVLPYQCEETNVNEYVSIALLSNVSMLCLLVFCLYFYTCIIRILLMLA